VGSARQDGSGFVGARGKRQDVNTLADDLSAARVERLADLLMDVEAAAQFLTPDERAEYERCRDSVIEARRHAERMAPFMWVGR
jgi:hypothetical protein